MKKVFLTIACFALGGMASQTRTEEWTHSGEVGRQGGIEVSDEVELPLVVGTQPTRRCVSRSDGLDLAKEPQLAYCIQYFHCHWKTQ